MKFLSEKYDNKSFALGSQDLTKDIWYVRLILIALYHHGYIKIFRRLSLVSG